MKILSDILYWVLNLYKTIEITIDGFTFSLMSIMVWGMLGFFIAVIVFSFFKD